MNSGVTAYGVVTSLGGPAPALSVVPVLAPTPAGFALPGLGAFNVNRWESSAVGAVVLIGLALAINAYYDA